jgi:hypothetical protein
MTAVEGMKQSGDYYWQACAMECYYAGLALLLINKAGLGVCFNSPIKFSVAC